MNTIKEKYNNDIKSFIEVCEKATKEAKHNGFRVGGSELDSLMGDNIFCPMEQLAAKKLKFIGTTSSSFASVDCIWGIIFEHIIVNVINDICETEILGNNIKILGEIKDAPHIIHKPDGLCVVALKRTPDNNWILKFKTDDVDEKDIKYVKAILELKSPLSRINNGISIPDYYKNQIKSGLALSSDYIQLGYYIEAYFRACSMKQLKQPLGYNMSIHVQDSKKDTSKFEEFKFGYILMLTKNTQIKIKRDLGKIDLADLKKLFKLIYDKVILYKSVGPYDSIKDTPLTIDQLYEKIPDNYGVIGILPWKLFRMSFTPLLKNQYSADYVSYIENISGAFVNKLTKVQTADDPHEAFDKEFGSIMLFDNNQAYLKMLEDDLNEEIE